VNLSRKFENFTLSIKIIGSFEDGLKNENLQTFAGY